MRWPLLRLSSRAISAARALPWVRSPSRTLAQDETSAEQGAERLRTLADLLVRAGVLDDQTADSVLAGHETALVARSRLDPSLFGHREVFARHGRPRTQVPAGQFRVVPVQATVPAEPDGSRGETRLLTLVIAPDIAMLTAAGRPSKLQGKQQHTEHPWPDAIASGIYSEFGGPTATDDGGNNYELDLGDWSSGQVSLNILARRRAHFRPTGGSARSRKNSKVGSGVDHSGLRIY